VVGRTIDRLVIASDGGAVLNYVRTEPAGDRPT
jgi:hypothetical protein